jgi:hypothetical protein
MQVNRGLVFWGVALVTAGTVALLIQSGTIADESARELWRFWPVALIVSGWPSSRRAPRSRSSRQSSQRSLSAGSPARWSRDGQAG